MVVSSILKTFETSTNSRGYPGTLSQTADQDVGFRLVGGPIVEGRKATPIKRKQRFQDGERVRMGVTQACSVGPVAHCFLLNTRATHAGKELVLLCQQPMTNGAAGSLFHRSFLLSLPLARFLARRPIEVIVQAFHRMFADTISRRSYFRMGLARNLCPPLYFFDLDPINC